MRLHVFYLLKTKRLQKAIIKQSLYSSIILKIPQSGIRYCGESDATSPVYSVDKIIQKFSDHPNLEKI